MSTLKAQWAPSPEEQAYIDLMNTPEYAARKAAEQEALIAWRDEGLENGTLRMGTGTCPSGEFKISAP